MSGCFGNTAEDRSREKELDRYLDSLEGPLICDRCGDLICELDEYEEVGNEILCGNCLSLDEDY